ncbi:hypothetical protein OG921_03160 [Aldersonia sp. NBC_00410]|uniref:hypothetical protein n=1 Tax=Aldersonia sp. NBC_00410 TaxID=2975954 RepID=UPI00224FDE87|nr:hypothetical protein [Aldersonia sp. NBC_00410]MCX5042190.1 hypothetical protein [Aldersonia sp. NBC_00410]
MSNEPDWQQLLKWDQPVTVAQPQDTEPAQPDEEPTTEGADLVFPAAVLVVGACGGAGSTTTALGIANASAIAGDRAVAIDATVGGGDLVDRGAAGAPSEHAVEELLASADARGALNDEAFAACSSATSVGATILHQAGDREPDCDLRPLDPYLRYRKFSAIYDAGRLWRPAHVRPLCWLPPSTPIVLTVPSRPDCFNRMRYSLDCLADFGGVDRLRSTVVVITSQRPGIRHEDIDVLRQHLTGRVVDVVSIPYDAELAFGGVVDHSRLRPETVVAYDQICAALAEAAA